jgi:hypothetical protein
MRYVLVGLLALSTSLLHSQAIAAEGRVSELKPSTLDAARVSKYARDNAAEQTKQVEGKSTKTHGDNIAKSASAQKPVRSASIPMSVHAGDFYIYDASSTLLTDRDEDAYFSEFRIRFDADSLLGDVRVYARLYLRRAGEVDWLLYHTTDDFWIEGQSNSDDYYVTTVLDDGYATGEYDVLIDLYESGYEGIVATIGPNETGALSYLPLEEVGLDVPIELPGYAIDDVSTTLLIDSDDDGHYSQFRIAFDPDADFDGGVLYARVWVRATGGTWIEEHVSEDFFVDASGEADVYSFTADWISGYPTSFYDVQIDLYDSASDLLVASAGSERSALAFIPLEDQSRDVRVNPPVGGGGGSASSSESGGGGSLNGWWLFCLLSLLGLKVRAPRQHTTRLREELRYLSQRAPRPPRRR